MNMIKSKEYKDYKKYYDYVDSFCIMMKLAGFHINKLDNNSPNTLMKMIDRAATPSELEFQEQFSVSSKYQSGWTQRGKFDDTKLAQCYIDFYIDTKANNVKIRFKFYNDLLENITNKHGKDLLNKYNVDFSNNEMVQELYIETFKDLKNLIEKIASGLEGIQ